MDDDCGAVNQWKGKGMLPLVILFLQTDRHTSLVPESQICQRCAGTSCRFPVALVSRRSYSQSTQTHHSRHPLHSPGSAGSQLERESRLGEGPYLFTAETAADCYRGAGNEDYTQRHNSTFTLNAALMTKLVWCLTVSTVCVFTPFRLFRTPFAWKAEDVG